MPMFKKYSKLNKLLLKLGMFKNNKFNNNTIKLII